MARQITIKCISDEEIAAVERLKGTSVEVIRVPGWRDDAHHRLGEQGVVVGGSGNCGAPILVEFPDGDKHAYTGFEIDYADKSLRRR